MQYQVVRTTDIQNKKFTNQKNLKKMSNFKVLATTFVLTVLAVYSGIKLNDYLKAKSGK